MNNKTMQELNEQYKDCPIQKNVYEVDGTEYRVTSHFIGEKDIRDVMLKYAEDRAMSEMLALVPTAEKM